jgi:hypothetical protein
MQTAAACLFEQRQDAGSAGPIFRKSKVCALLLELPLEFSRRQVNVTNAVVVSSVPVSLGSENSRLHFCGCKKMRNKYVGFLFLTVASMKLAGCLLNCCAIYSSTSLPTFQRFLLHPS